jgi:hypothetical protein
MLGLAIGIISALWLLASVAVLASLEVIVLALGAFPTAIRELEVIGQRPHGLPRLLDIHGGEHGNLLVLDVLGFKIVDFLGKLRNAF